MDRLPTTLTDLLARVATGTIPSDADANQVFDTLIPSHRSGIVASLKAALEGDTPDVTAGAVLRKALDRLDARTTETKAVVAALMEGVVEEPDKEAAVAAAEDAVEVAAEAVATVAEAVDQTDPAAVEAVATAEELIDEAANAVAEAQTASVARPNISRPTVKAVKAHATVAVRPRAVGLAASMASPNSLQDVGKLFSMSASTFRSVGKAPLFAIETDFTDARTLRTGDMEGNTAKLDAALGLRALAASGGICAPLIGDQDRHVFGVTDRPVRDGLPGFGTTDVGGVRYAPAFILGGGQLGAVDADVYPWDNLLGNVDGAGVWTYAADLAPDSSVKPCWAIPCEAELTAYVDAITFCAQIGTFAYRFSGNQWSRALDAGSVAHARAAEQNLLRKIIAASVAVTYAGIPITTIRQVVSGIGKAAEHLRNSNRLGSSTLMQAIMPDWIRTALREDIISKHLAAGTPPEQIGVTDAQIDQIFAAWKVAPIFTQDLSILLGATAGALAAWPDTTALIFPYGTHVYLDGGRFDTGVMIDPQLMETNELKLFFETFEGVLNYHAQSIALAITPTDGFLDTYPVA